MKQIKKPINFDGNKYREIYGDYPTSTLSGFIDVADDITSLDDCVNNTKEIEQRIKVAWETANSFSEEQFDSNSRFSLLWKKSSNPSQVALQMIHDVEVWYQSLWEHYGRIKQQILSGQNVKFNKEVIGNCPYTIWQIKDA